MTAPGLRAAGSGRTKRPGELDGGGADTADEPAVGLELAIFEPLKSVFQS